MTLCVAIDVDDTMAFLSHEIAKALSELSGKNIPYEQWWTHNWCELYGMEASVMQQHVRTTVDYSSLEPTSHLWSEFHRVLVNMGVKPVYITARGTLLGKEQALAITRHWLNSIDVPATDENIMPVGWGQGKGKTLKALDYVVMASIDDHHREVEGYIKEFPRAHNCLVDSPVNKNIREREGLTWMESRVPIYGIQDIALMKSHIERTIEVWYVSHQ